MKEINSDTFGQEVLKPHVPVLVDFYSDHCPPCRLLTPILERLAGDLEGRARIVKMNVAGNDRLARRLGVVAVPTVIVFKGGEMVARLVGLQNRDRLLEAVEMAEGEQP